MRKRLNLDLINLDDGLLSHIFGPYGAGKTHLAGDFLRWAKSSGPVAFLNIAGEDGYSSLGAMGLGEIGETVESVDDYVAALADYRKVGLAGLSIDSLPALYRLQLTKVCGSVRYPDPKVDGERAKMMWGQLNLGVMDLVVKSRNAAKYVLWVSPFDKSEDAVGGGKGLTPDLPGKLAWGSAGWFDLVGYLSAETLGPTNVKRKVTFAPASNILTRQRLPRPLTQDITIPEGGGGWERIITAIQATFTPPAKGATT